MRVVVVVAVQEDVHEPVLLVAELSDAERARVDDGPVSSPTDASAEILENNILLFVAVYIFI